jgi:hypothetical protein
MADIVLTAAQVRRVKADTDEVMDFTAGATITVGQLVYFDTTTGKLAVADGSGTSTAQVRGIALNGAAAGEPVGVLKRGKIAGYTLAGDYDSRVYLSDTAGAFADAAGTVAVTLGRVVRGNDSSATKLLYFECNWLSQFT